MPNSEMRFPIKVVLTEDKDHDTKKGGGRAKSFGKVTDSIRRDLAHQIEEVIAYFKPIIRDTNLPAVARVILKPEAIAKSHRPEKVFASDTCPIIGGEDFGKLLIGVSNMNLKKLRNRVLRKNTKTVECQLSTIQHIEPFKGEQAAGQLGIDGLQKYLQENHVEILSLRLFEFRDKISRGNIEQAFLRLTASLNLPAPERLEYLSGLHMYRLAKVAPEMISTLANFVGTQSIGVFPQFGFQTQYISCGKVDDKIFPMPEPGKEYPIVGIIDSGTDLDNQLLQSWVSVRDEEDVPRVDQDNNHGSFVAGLIVNSRTLNHNDALFPSTQAKIIDVVAMPKDGTDSESLLDTIRRVVPKYPQAKIWNLSVSMINAFCQNDSFSPFAIELDKLQQQYGITFVTCAGNYTEQPLRTWPPQELNGRDRIFSPADNVLGITVGSLAHTDRPNSVVPKNSPSPFSRRGPGAAFLIKPDVCHYAGNCDANLQCHQVGVLSIDGKGNISEAIGTSFSTPLITSILSNIRHGLAEKEEGLNNLTKALLIHSAVLENGPIRKNELHYKGYGVPSDIRNILTCAPWQATLVINEKMEPNLKEFSRASFPMPECFLNEDGSVDGEILITLVYDPPLVPEAGAEYCQVDMKISLGTYIADSNGKFHQVGQVPLEPQNYSELFEKHQLEHGFRWSPVKVYRGQIKETTLNSWRVQLDMTYRLLLPQEKSQRFSLIITLLDPKKEKPVYDHVIRAMNRSGWQANDLQIRGPVRQQLRM